MEALKHFGDILSISVVISTIAGWLPPLAALCSILWIVFQFYHSPPVRQWRKDRKEKKNGLR